MAQYDLYKGRKVSLSDAKIYERYYSKIETKSVTGDYFIFDESIKNNKIRICRHESDCGLNGMKSGWVDIMDLIDNDEIKVGDAVNVTGNIYKYADGTGDYKGLYHEAMYVVDVLEANWSYKYGVARGKTDARLGFVRLGDLEKNIVLQYTNRPDIDPIVKEDSND